MISASVSLSVSCTVHVSGADLVSYPLISLQSVSSLAVGDILATNISKTNKYVTVLRNVAVNVRKLSTPVRSETDILL